MRVLVTGARGKVGRATVAARFCSARWIRCAREILCLCPEPGRQRGRSTPAHNSRESRKAPKQDLKQLLRRKLASLPKRRSPAATPVAAVRCAPEARLQLQDRPLTRDQPLCGNLVHFRRLRWYSNGTGWPVLLLATFCSCFSPAKRLFSEWSRGDSNPWPPPCKGGTILCWAFPVFAK